MTATTTITTEPEEQENALHALALASRTAPTLPPRAGFDWRALVADARPGADTPVQREQALRMQRTRRALHVWADQFGLPEVFGTAIDRFEEAGALFAVVSTPIGTKDGQTLLLGAMILWIYCLDTVLDRQSAGRASDPGWVDAVLTTSLDAVVDSWLPVRLRRGEGQLGQFAGLQRADLPEVAGRLALALDAFFEEAQRQWQLQGADLRSDGSAGSDRFRVATVAVQLARLGHAMRQELLWSGALQQGADPSMVPSLARYLAVARPTTGVHPVAAVVCGFTTEPERTWEHAIGAIDAAAQVVRLTNDIHTYEADVVEGHLTAVTVALRDLGLPLTGLDPRTSDQVLLARRELVGHLDTALSAFGSWASDPMQLPPSYFLRYMVAFALSYYGDGRQFR